MMHEVIDRWITYLGSRRELRGDNITFHSEDATSLGGDGPHVIFVPFAKTNRQLPDAPASYPSYDIVVRVVVGDTTSGNAFMRADIIASKLQALIQLNPKLIDRSHLFGREYEYLNNSDVIGFSYIKDGNSNLSARAGRHQKEVQLYLRCERSEGVASVPGIKPEWYEGAPPIPEDRDEYLGLYNPEDQQLYYSGIDARKIVIRFFKEDVFESAFNLADGKLKD